VSDPDSDLLHALRAALAARYTIDRALGRGGMGTVVLARDLVLDRLVAIKVIDPELAATAALRQRFLDEARTVARLRHPNIVTVFDAGVAEGLLWFAMEYIDGESLRDRLDRVGALAEGEAVAIVREVAAALSAAHAQGIVHRDVKPENILLDRATGRPHLTDFGIARALAGGDDDGRRTGTGFVLGSPRYMSPEQASGDRALDGRSDVYSLGLVAYEALAGAAAFEATSPQALLVKQITERPAPLASRAPGVAPAVAAAVERALEKEPAARFADATAFADALGGGSPPAPPRPPLPASAARAASARPGASPERGRGRAVLVVGGLALLGGLGWFASRGAPGAVAPATDRADGEGGAGRSYFVVPFDVQSADPTLEWLREGSVNMLTLTLAQWTDVRVVDYERELDLLRDAKLDTAARIGLGDAQALGRRAGVRTLVMGQLQATGDSLILIARTYDVASGARIDQTQRSAPRTADPRPLFDLVARDLLGLDGAPEGVVDVARATTPSIEAYRSYLAATRLINRWQLAAADSALTRALAADSTFALALYRRSTVRAWREVSPTAALADAEASVRFADRLVPSQRALVEANLLLTRGFVDLADGRPDSARVRNAAAEAAYTALLGRDSTVAEAWYGLGLASRPFLSVGPDAIPGVARAASRSLTALRRSVALDTGFYFAYPALVSLYQIGASGNALALRGEQFIPTSALPAGERDRLQRATRDLVVDALGRWLRAAPDASLAYVQLADAYLLGAPDSAVRVLEQALARPAARTPTMPFLLAMAQLRAEDPRALATLRAAVRTTTPEALRANTADERFFVVGQSMRVAAAYGQPRDVDAVVRLALATDSVMPYTRLPVGMTLRWFAGVMRLAMGSPWTGTLRNEVERGVAYVDSTTLPFGEVIRAQSIHVAYLLGLTTRDGRYARLLRRWAQDTALALPELDALVALGRGDSVAARRAAARIPAPDSLARLPQSMSGLRMVGRAEALAQLGETRRALATYAVLDPARFLDVGGFGDPGYAVYARSWLARARLHEQVGERERALAAYQRFLTWWSGADAAYDAERREAQAAVARLRDRA
jgi:serine/threonine-protein kinase